MQRFYVCRYKYAGSEDRAVSFAFTVGERGLKKLWGWVLPCYSCSFQQKKAVLYKFSFTIGRFLRSRKKFHFFSLLNLKIRNIDTGNFGILKDNEKLRTLWHCSNWKTCQTETKETFCWVKVWSSLKKGPVGFHDHISFHIDTANSFYLLFLPLCTESTEPIWHNVSANPFL